MQSDPSTMETIISPLQRDSNDLCQRRVGLPGRTLLSVSGPLGDSDVPLSPFCGPPVRSLLRHPGSLLFPPGFLDHQDRAQPAPPVVRIGLDLLQESAGHAGRHPLPLLPRSDGLHVHAKDLAENRLTDPQRRAHLLDLLKIEGTGRQIEDWKQGRSKLLILAASPFLPTQAENHEFRQQAGYWKSRHRDNLKRINVLELIIKP